MKFSRNQIIIVAIVFLILLVVILLFTGIIPGLRSKEKPITGELAIWGVGDGEKAFTDTLIASYKALRPYVKVQYQKLDESTYEADLINALAAGTGPDIFMIKNTWLIKHKDKLVPLTANQFPLATFQQLYPSVAESDFVNSGQVYALPLYLDTLALFYNRNLLDQAGIANPPKTWDELISDIPRLRQLDSSGKISRAAIALGGSNKSVSHASDIMSLLMEQNGVNFVDQNYTRATFADGGDRALEFYTSFASPSQANYTWDESFGNSLDSFANETAAMMLGYDAEVPIIKEKNPFLNFAISPMLQTITNGSATNYPSYYGLTVSNKSKNPALAWDFIAQLLTSDAIMKNYLVALGHPPALRSFIAQAEKDPSAGLFASQALTAKSWPQIDAAAVSASFSRMIELVLNGQASVDRAIKQAESEVTALMQRRTINN